MTGGHAAALDAHGGLWLWGGNGCGQLGLGVKQEFVDTPLQPPFLCVLLSTTTSFVSCDGLQPGIAPAAAAVV